MDEQRSDRQIREVNVRYHDAAAGEYDAKWGIDFDETGQRQVRGKFEKALGARIRQPFRRALEIGAGTGYFGLNLMQAGVIEELTCTDISAGMVATLSANAQRLGLAGIQAIEAEAGSLPLADESFDLVFGHAILHHLPDLAGAFAEFRRVLAPGGTIVFAGEPSLTGDLLARAPKRLATLLAPAWRAALRLPSAPDTGSAPHDGHAFEGQVDIHTFAPAELVTLAQRAGFEHARCRGEELVANWFGWFNRSLEASAAPERIPWLWRQYAFRGYLLLQQLDARALEPLLPAGVFYNLLLTAQRPAAPDVADGAAQG
jgi:ubiquinone/menaquinone biosynthesis C-methylase UbiE